MAGRDDLRGERNFVVTEPSDARLPVDEKGSPGEGARLTIQACWHGWFGLCEGWS